MYVIFHNASHIKFGRLKQEPLFRKLCLLDFNFKKNLVYSILIINSSKEISLTLSVTKNMINYIYFSLKDHSNSGSSPGEHSSKSSSPVTISGTKPDVVSDTNQLQVLVTPRPQRSKSMDVSLMGLSLDDAKITIDMKNNEITITPTGSKAFGEGSKEASQKSVHYNVIDEKLNMGGRITQEFENFQDGLEVLSEFHQKEAQDKAEGRSDASNAKLTIKGPGNYIKKLIQQFSEGPFETEDPKPESERAVSTPSIRDRADAICKKCFHYKGKIGK